MEPKMGNKSSTLLRVPLELRDALKAVGDHLDDRSMVYVIKICLMEYAKNKGIIDKKASSVNDIIKALS